jgi:hypothetical protein
MSDKAYYITQSLVVIALVALSMTAAGCDVIGGIFKAGVWVGVIIVALIVAIVGWAFKSMKGSS